MSSCRVQALLEAPVESVWELVGDPARHPEWWPRVVEVRGESFEEGAEYVQVTKTPFGANRTDLRIEHLEDLHEVHLRCQQTGTFAHWQLTPAQDGTFVQVELGMDPRAPSDRLFDRVLGKAYFRRWAEKSLDALRGAARSRSSVA